MMSISIVQHYIIYICIYIYIRRQLNIWLNFILNVYFQYLQSTLGDRLNVGLSMARGLLWVMLRERKNEWCNIPFSSTLSCDFRPLTIIIDNLRVISYVLWSYHRKKYCGRNIISHGHLCETEFTPVTWVCIPQKNHSLSLMVSGIFITHAPDDFRGVHWRAEWFRHLKQKICSTVTITK